jgi:hypothetical protein
VIDSEDLKYRTHVGVKYVLHSGSWSRKTLAGMELIVKSHTCQVTLSNPRIGGFLGCDWYFDAAKTNIETWEIPTSSDNHRKWIVLRGHEGGELVELALWNKFNQREIWAALVAAGSWPIGAPEFD